jgi:acyl dehydratase
VGISFEDLEVGSTTEIGRYTFEADDIKAFAQRYDPQPFHLDEEAGKASPFGGLVASGWHTCSVFMGLLIAKLGSDSTSMGSPGVDSISWLKPVRAGDTITMYRRFGQARVGEQAGSRHRVDRMDRRQPRRRHGDHRAQQGDLRVARSAGASA